MSLNIPGDYATLSKSEQEELQQSFEKLKIAGKSEEDALEEVVTLYRYSGPNVTTEVCIGAPTVFSDFQGFAGVDVHLVQRCQLAAVVALPHDVERLLLG